MPGAAFVLELWACVAAQRAAMLERASRQGQRVERGSRGPVRVAPGSELTVVVRLDPLVVRDPRDTLLWDGEIASVPFVVDVPAGLRAGSYPGQISLLRGGLLLTRLAFDVAVGAATAEAAPLALRRQVVRSAFASYASQDRAEVLRRVQGIGAAGIDVFLDVLSLRAGDDWEAALLRNIQERDVFYLFWSAAARRSQWVDREWRHALRERGVDFIHPIPLVDPAEAPPPPELATRHFNDLILACLRSQAAAPPAADA
jgi:hypothetical protein